MDNGNLKLTRKPNQPLYLQFVDQNGSLQEINISISKISGQQAMFSIKAPKSVSVTRGELIRPI